MNNSERFCFVTVRYAMLCYANTLGTQQQKIFLHKQNTKCFLNWQLLNNCACSLSTYTYTYGYKYIYKYNRYLYVWSFRDALLTLKCMYSCVLSGRWTGVFPTLSLNGILNAVKEVNLAMIRSLSPKGRVKTKCDNDEVINGRITRNCFLLSPRLRAKGP